jgi:hypothetical protein
VAVQVDMRLAVALVVLEQAQVCLLQLELITPLPSEPEALDKLEQLLAQKALTPFFQPLLLMVVVVAVEILRQTKTAAVVGVEINLHQQVEREIAHQQPRHKGITVEQHTSLDPISEVVVAAGLEQLGEMLPQTRLEETAAMGLRHPFQDRRLHTLAVEVVGHTTVG